MEVFKGNRLRMISYSLNVFFMDGPTSNSKYISWFIFILFYYLERFLLQNNASCTNFYKLYVVSEQIFYLNLHETYPQF
jgi:hypothetical protein